MSLGKHDPETLAADYLAGMERTGTRRRFEQHLLECEECWREVRLARLGRSLAEGAREVAPAQLREDVRAAVAFAGPQTRSRRPIRMAIAAALAAVLGLTAGGLLLFGRSGQPDAIAAALAAFRTNAVPVGAPPAHTAPDLAPAGLSLQAGAHEVMGGHPVDAFIYLSPEGHRIMVLMSAVSFPHARGAVDRFVGPPAWEAKADGVMMVCLSQPMSYLLMGEDGALLSRAEKALGLDQVTSA